MARRMRPRDLPTRRPRRHGAGSHGAGSHSRNHPLRVAPALQPRLVPLPPGCLGAPSSLAAADTSSAPPRRGSPAPPHSSWTSVATLQSSASLGVAPPPPSHFVVAPGVVASVMAFSSAARTTAANASGWSAKWGWSGGAMARNKSASCHGAAAARAPTRSLTSEHVLPRPP
jgi:hypothetical protein